MCDIRRRPSPVANHLETPSFLFPPNVKSQQHLQWAAPTRKRFASVRQIRPLGIQKQTPQQPQSANPHESTNAYRGHSRPAPRAPQKEADGCRRQKYQEISETQICATQYDVPSKNIEIGAGLLFWKAHCGEYHSQRERVQRRRAQLQAVNTSHLRRNVPSRNLRPRENAKNERENQKENQKEETHLLHDAALRRKELCPVLRMDPATFEEDDAHVYKREESEEERGEELKGAVAEWHPLRRVPRKSGKHTNALGEIRARTLAASGKTR
ncbi:hypothetical protein B0H16DRAFT_1483817 [Mycena metata]|uniref:Uncharacterized protein n=1 Tax=Mycena metata TaxID=1033252 RepID=A0AAD7GQR0_9AGAR|nr:hypothetical protein B0H16DRAFT_1483817 [Mycena metata]